MPVFLSLHAQPGFSPSPCQADTDHDGGVSYEEFERWYSSGSAQSGFTVNAGTCQQPVPRTSATSVNWPPFFRDRFPCDLCPVALRFLLPLVAATAATAAADVALVVVGLVGCSGLLLTLRALCVQPYLGSIAALAHASQEGLGRQAGASASASESAASGSASSTLDALRDATGLGSLQPRAVFNALKKYAHNGELNREEFTRYYLGQPVVVVVAVIVRLCFLFFVYL